MLVFFAVLDYSIVLLQYKTLISVDGKRDFPQQRRCGKLSDFHELNSLPRSSDDAR